MLNNDSALIIYDYDYPLKSLLIGIIVSLSFETINNYLIIYETPSSYYFFTNYTIASYFKYDKTPL